MIFGDRDTDLALRFLGVTSTDGASTRRMWFFDRIRCRNGRLSSYKVIDKSFYAISKENFWENLGRARV